MWKIAKKSILFPKNVFLKEFYDSFRKCLYLAFHQKCTMEISRWWWKNEENRNSGNYINCTFYIRGHTYSPWFRPYIDQDQNFDKSLLKKQQYVKALRCFTERYITIRSYFNYITFVFSDINLTLTSYLQFCNLIVKNTYNA